MIKKKFYRYLIYSISFFLILNLIILNLSKCTVSSFTKTALDFNFNHALTSCQKLYKNYSNNLIKKIFLDSFLEISLRKIREDKYGIKYNYLKFDDFEKKKISQFEISPEKHKNIEEINKYLKNVKKDEYHSSSWFTAGGDYKNLRFNKSNNINVQNINNLKLLWKFESFDSIKNPKKWRQNIAINPIIADNKIIFISADYKIIALDPVKGKILWTKKFLLEPTKRGITSSKEIDGNYLYLTIGSSLIKINIANGKLVKSFGKNGIINNIKSLTAPIIFNNEIFITSFASVRVFDLKTGKFNYEINIHPKKKDFRSGGVVWGGNALDKKNKILFLPVGNPRPALIGLNRPGENNNANSLVAIDLKKKKIKWVFQDVIHDLWDFDISSPPILTNLRFENKILEVVVITTKTGNTHVLERNTGHSLFKIKYKKAPSSEIFGEKTSMFQINQNLPEKLTQIGFQPDQLNQKDKENFKIQMELERATYGWFEPPSFGKKLIIKGIHGGATWPGSAINPKSNIIYTPVNNYPFYILVEGKTISNLKPKHDYINLYNKKCSSCHGRQRNGVIDANTKKDVEMIEKIKVKNKRIVKGYMPSLIGHSLFNEKNLEELFSTKKFNFYHKNLISNEEKEGLKDLFKIWDQKLLKNNSIQLRYHWAKFTNELNLPPTKESWGKIISMDLKTGKKLWEKNIGKLNSNESLNNMKGTINYGGLALNGGNVLFATGTPDNNVYALNALNGEVIWSYKMKAAGSTSPIIYEINNKQYLSVLATGGFFKEFKSRASVLYTFAMN